MSCGAEKSARWRMDSPAKRRMRRTIMPVLFPPLFPPSFSAAVLLMSISTESAAIAVTRTIFRAGGPSVSPVRAWTLSPGDVLGATAGSGGRRSSEPLAFARKDCACPFGDAWRHSGFFSAAACSRALRSAISAAIFSLYSFVVRDQECQRAMSFLASSTDSPRSVSRFTRA